MTQALITLDSNTTFAALAPELERVLAYFVEGSGPVWFASQNGSATLCLDRSVTGYDHERHPFMIAEPLLTAPVLAQPTTRQRLFAYLEELFSSRGLAVLCQVQKDEGLVWSFTAPEVTRERGVWGLITLHMAPHGYQLDATLQPDESPLEANYTGTRSFGGGDESAALARLILACTDQTSLASRLLALAEDQELLTRHDGNRATFDTYQALPIVPEEEEDSPSPSATA